MTKNISTRQYLTCHLVVNNFFVTVLNVCMLFLLTITVIITVNQFWIMVMISIDMFLLLISLHWTQFITPHSRSLLLLVTPLIIAPYIKGGMGHFISKMRCPLLSFICMFY